MAEYTIWVGGERPWNRSYLGEIGGVELSQEQVNKYFTFGKDGKPEFDRDLIADKVDVWDEKEADFPTWDTITDGCMRWGAYTDQLVGVCKTGEEEAPVFLKDVEEVPAYEEYEFINPDGVCVLYNSCEKGGYSGTFTLPDDEKFDEKNLKLQIRVIEECFSIVVGATYKGEDICMEGDSDGKGIDWFIVHNDHLVRFK